MDVQNEVDVKTELSVLSLKEIEELARQYALRKEAQARMKYERAVAEEHIRREEIVAFGKDYLPERLKNLVKFDRYNESMSWKPILLIDAIEWRVEMAFYDNRLGSYEMPNYPYQALIPVLTEGEDGWFVWWRPSQNHTENLIEAISEAIEHELIDVMKEEAEERNKNRQAKKTQELSYVPAETPDVANNDVMAPLITLIRDVAKEVVEERNQ